MGIPSQPKSGREVDHSAQTSSRAASLALLGVLRGVTPDLLQICE